MGLGKKLTDIIASRNLKVTQVAQMADVPASTLYSIIDRDNKKVDIDVLIRICKALDVSTDYILQNDDVAETIVLDNHEKKVITAYRNNPDMQPAVDRLLLIDNGSAQQSVIFRAASSKDNHSAEITTTSKDFSKIKQSDDDTI